MGKWRQRTKMKNVCQAADGLEEGMLIWFGNIDIAYF
jgi:hypothetical protein